MDGLVLRVTTLSGQVSSGVHRRKKQGCDCEGRWAYLLLGLIPIDIIRIIRVHWLWNVHIYVGEEPPMICEKVIHYKSWFNHTLSGPCSIENAFIDDVNQVNVARTVSCINVGDLNKHLVITKWIIITIGDAHPKVTTIFELLPSTKPTFYGKSWLLMGKKSLSANW